MVKNEFANVLNSGLIVLSIKADWIDSCPFNLVKRIVFSLWIERTSFSKLELVYVFVNFSWRFNSAISVDKIPRHSDNFS